MNATLDFRRKVKMIEDDGRIVEHKGKTWETDYDGFLIYVSPHDIKPDEDWYDYIRMKEGISAITMEHREVLEYFQDHYRKFGAFPPITKVDRELNKSKESVFKLFFPSKDPMKTIIIMAGLPRPIT
ncbi:MAG: TusE/DsrC/DsvC family sulfur relay protein [Bacteroidetes bacterium]|nr:TusE/DsrC/DsvC family sulfur relay protein [Bacteroidota bacterium]